MDLKSRGCRKLKGGEQRHRQASLFTPSAAAALLCDTRTRYDDDACLILKLYMGVQHAYLDAVCIESPGEHCTRMHTKNCWCTAITGEHS